MNEQTELELLKLTIELTKIALENKALSVKPAAMQATSQLEYAFNEASRLVRQSYSSTKAQ
jgi:hypothetical protein